MTKNSFEILKRKQNEQIVETLKNTLQKVSSLLNSALCIQLRKSDLTLSSPAQWGI